MFTLTNNSLFQLTKATTEKIVEVYFFHVNSLTSILCRYENSHFLLLQLQIHEKKLFNPLHPDVSMHILHTVSFHLLTEKFGAEKGEFV